MGLKEQNRSRKKEINIVGQAFKEVLSDTFNYVEVYVYDYFLEVKVNWDGVEVSDSINFDTIHSLLSGEINEREFYKEFGNSLADQIQEIEDLRNKLVTPSGFEKIERTDFLAEIESLFNSYQNINVAYYICNEVGRTKGKTTSLVYLAMKHNIPILLDNKEMMKIINKDFPEVETIYFTDERVERLERQTVLIDELDYENTLTLRDLGIRFFGFIR